MKDLYAIARQLAEETESVIVMFSTGKDSCALYDVCAKFFPVIYPVIMVHIPGLSWNERLIEAYERRYGAKVTQVRHPDAVNHDYQGRFKHAVEPIKVRKYTEKMLHDELRERFCCQWIAQGMKKSDSLQRRGWLSQCNGIERKFGRVFPLAEWTDPQVWNYCSRERLPVSEWYRRGYRDVGFPTGEVIDVIRREYPDDYKLIISLYPQLEAELLHA